MKEQYVGDIGDFGKIGLLKSLAGQPTCADHLKCAMVWWLTPNDHRADGGLTGYLNGTRRNMDLYRACDPDLYDKLVEIVRLNRRRVASVRSDALMPTDTEFYEQTLLRNRDEYVRGAIEVVLRERVELAFVDPDNGLPRRRVADVKDQERYVFYSELRRLWRTGRSLVVYQHFHRIGTHGEQMQAVMRRITEELLLDPAVRPFAMRWSAIQPRAYIVIPQLRHREILRARAEAMLASTWGAHFTLHDPARDTE